MGCAPLDFLGEVYRCGGDCGWHALRLSPWPHGGGVACPPAQSFARVRYTDLSLNGGVGTGRVVGWYVVVFWMGELSGVGVGGSSPSYSGAWFGGGPEYGPNDGDGSHPVRGVGSARSWCIPRPGARWAHCSSLGVARHVAGVKDHLLVMKTRFVGVQSYCRRQGEPLRTK